MGKPKFVEEEAKGSLQSEVVNTISDGNGLNVYEQKGLCPVCGKAVQFTAQNSWLRDYYRCSSCQSLPRDRALFRVLDFVKPDWREKNVIEFAPANNNIKMQISGSYISSQYYPEYEFGSMVNGHQNEDIESTTFKDFTFDCIIHEDVLEHVNSPESVILDLIRILKRDGVTVFTVPINKNLEKSRQRASLSDDGDIEYICPPEYYGNPVGGGNSLVMWIMGKILKNF